MRDAPARRLRVALVVNSFDPVFKDRAGGHVHLIEVAKRWPEFDIAVFGPEDARASIRRDLPRAEFFVSPSCDGLTRNRAVVFLFRALTSFAIVPQLRRYDAILCLSQFLPDVVPAVLAKPRSSTVVLWHLMEPPGKREGSYLNNYIAYAAEQLGRLLVERFFPAFIVGSALLAREMRLDGRKPYFVTTNGVDHLPAPRRGLAAQRHALYIGRLHPAKGVEDLLDVWKAVVRRYPDARLTIAGGGAADYEQSLLERIEHYGLLQSIHLAGRVSEAEKAELLAGAELFVFPSKEEGWGIALAEAMANGLPCVTYDLPVFQEVFPKGRLSAPSGDVSAFADRVLQLFGDAELTERVRADARALAETFSWDRAAQVEARAVKSIAVESH